MPRLRTTAGPCFPRVSPIRNDLYTLAGICWERYTPSVLTPFEVLAEPNRRRILDLLLAAERSVADLTEATTLSQPSVSKHLRVLRRAGLVDVRADAQRRIYRVRAEPLRAVDEWLLPYRKLWGARLDAFELPLQTMRPDEPQSRR